MKPSDFRTSDFMAAAAEYLNGDNLLADTDELVAKGDAYSVYQRPFVERCVIAEKADKFQYFQVVAKLRKMKDFRITEFEELVDQERAQQFPPLPAPRGPDATTDTLGHMLNDHGNACRIRDLYGDDLRYCPKMNSWIVWDGMRWAVDDIGHARELAKLTMIEFLKQAAISRNDPCEKFARLSLNAKNITSMLKSLDTVLVVRPEDLDTSPWLLNFINGTVDLRTGELKPHDRADLITKMVHHRYIEDTQCPLWKGFMRKIMGGGANASESDLDRSERMTDYLQRVLGYSVTGSTSEKAVFIPFGESGNNGKTTMLTVVRELVKEYSVLLQVETLMTKQDSSTVQEDLAKLRGARFVQTSETEEGQRLSQGKLKRITQGMGDITATRKYEHSITFKETHHIFIDTNRRPDIRDAEDKATFVRLHPIPFLVEIPASEIDKQFPEKLAAEAGGILAWIVEGARLWYKNQSLGSPVEVDKARDDWRDSSAQISRFISDKAVPSSTGKIDLINTFSGSDLIYKDYKKWCVRTNEKPLVRHIFVEKLTSHGYPTEKRKCGHVVLGLSINPDPPEENQPDYYP